MLIDVIDLNIENLNFPKKYDSNRRFKASTLYERNCVEIEEVDKQKDGLITVTANVNGNRGVYRVALKIKNNMVEDYSCGCYDYASGSICKHILATCLETIQPHVPSTQEGMIRVLEALEKQKAEEQKQKEYEQKYSYALNTIKEYKNEDKLDNPLTNVPNQLDVKKLFEETKKNMNTSNNNSLELVKNVKIEPQIQVNNSSSFEVSFKIGQTTMYSLKDLATFYNSFSKGKVVDFGKKLKMELKKENFEKEDEKLLDYILQYGEMIEYNKKTTRETYYYHTPKIQTKIISVYGDKIDDFFDVIKNKQVQITARNITEKYEFTNEKLDIFVELKKEKEYILKANINDYMFITSYKKIYIFMANKIYIFEFSEELERVLNLFEYKNEILIPEDKFQDFSKYVFPKMNNYLFKENMPAEIIKEGIIANSLAVKMYLDLDEKENIIMELKFCYNDHEFNVLDSNYKKYIQEKKIVQNVIEEKNVLTRIFMDGFEIINGKRYFVLKNLDATYEFLSDKINQYMNDYEILVTDKLKNKEIKKPKLSSVSVRLDNGLLELDISKLDFDINEIKDVLKNYSIKKKYYKLKNGDFLSLDQSDDLEFLENIANSFDVKFEKANNGVIKLPVNRSIYLDQLLRKNKNMNINKNGKFSNLINNVENMNFADEIKIEEDFKDVLRDYQKVGYKWLKTLESYNLGGILADDMGLGKTLQVIALLASDKTNKKTSIVVCPSSLVLNWKAEIEKWCPKIKVCIIKGDAETRKSLVNSYKLYDLLVTSYDLLKRDITEYEGIIFKYIIADEAQYIKNFTTQNATALKSLEGETKFALTGTPIENSVSELWSIFDFVMPGYLYTYNKFRKKIEEPIIKQEDKESLEKLKTLINPFVLRRIKDDVLTELPEKNITIMNNEMTTEQQKIYTSYLAQTKKEITEELNANGFEKSKFKILMLLTRLRQICCHPSLFIDNYEGESGKLNQCMDIISEAIDAGHRILLFSSYTSMFDIIEERLKFNNIKYYRLTGTTAVNKRVDMVEQFNKDASIKIFLISLKAGGTGLNLTGADVVIHYDPWWNVSSENQATDRAYRIGQKNSVQVYKLITTNSIEEKINKLQEKKSKLSKQLLSTEETFINNLSKDEIMALFA